MPPPPPATAGRIPPAPAALAESGVDVLSVAATIETAAAAVANVHANNAPETVVALSAHGADLRSIAAAALVDMVVPVVRNRTGHEGGGGGSGGIPGGGHQGAAPRADGGCPRGGRGLLGLLTRPH